MVKKKSSAALKNASKKSLSSYRKKKREFLTAKKVSGRKPKKFSDSQCLKLGKDLLAWLDDPDGGKSAAMFVRWYGVKHGMCRGEWKALRLRAYFSPYYERGRKMLAENIMKNRILSQSYGGRYLAIYDEDLCEWEEEKADRQMDRQIKIKESESRVAALGIADFTKSVKDGTLLDELTQKNLDER